MVRINIKHFRGNYLFPLYSLLFFTITLILALSSFGSNSGLTPADIDKMIQAKWTENSLKPSDRSTDEEFIRRVYIDITGRVPEADDVKQFLNDRSSDKRTKKINELLNSPEFGEYMADTWINVLFTQENLQKFPVMTYDYVRKHFAEKFNNNEPYNKFVYDLVSARGLATTDPEVLFMSRFTTPEDAAGNVMKIFMGRKIQCAQCHKHPYENISQDDFYGVAAFFSRTKAVPLFQKSAVEKIAKLLGKYDKAIKRMRDKEMADNTDGNENMPEDMKNMPEHKNVKKNQDKSKNKKQKERLIPPEWAIDTLQAKLNRSQTGPYIPDVLVWDAVNGQMQYTNKAGEKKTITPKYLGGASESGSAGVERRELLAKNLTTTESKQLARAYVNRVWKHFFGYGFVNPIDEFTEKDEGTNPELLNKIADNFIASGFDIKKLFTLIANTEAYQLSSTPNESNKEDHDYFSRAILRPLSPVQLANSLLTTSGYFNLNSIKNKDPQEIEKLKIKLLKLFIFTFDDDEMSEAENFSGTITQALLMMNSDIAEKVTDKKPGNIVAYVLNNYNNASDRVDMLYLNTLSRYPTKTEKKDLLEKASEGKEFYEDLEWALLNSSEFIFNH